MLSKIILQVQVLIAFKEASKSTPIWVTDRGGL
jgi:hypothetical protein